ncbi:MAG: hypothetical protein K2Y05_04215 [Hyphomicrobiaceae bacterium]|nr:hypothetical protein [Hyphomicrobiaceae bacterium]
MKTVLLHGNPAVTAARVWLEAKLGTTFPPAQIFPQTNARGELIAACAYFNASPQRVFMAWAGNGAAWARPRVMRAWFVHAFDTLGCAMAVGMIDERNARAIRFVKKIGGVDSGVRHRQLDGSVLIEFRMTRAQCRWLT